MSDTCTVWIRQQGEPDGFDKPILAPRGSVLLEVLQKNGIFLPAYCGGAGKCKKCGVKVEKGTLPVTAEDRLAFSDEELQRGMRLSCRAVVEGELSISIAARKEENFAAVGSGREYVEMRADNPYQAGDYGIAIDIGTTTLAFALLDLESGRIRDACAMTNSQRAFGADVISRIQASNDGKRERLLQCIRKDLKDGIENLARRNLDASHRIRHIVIAANTVMLHLLRGYSCEGLSRYPFQAKTLAREELDFKEVFGKTEDERLLQANVTLLPGMSAFVGADITAGLLACHIFDGGKAALFLDLGTNGEMALRVGKRILTASAAAGPAFEGGNIKRGIGSVPGAISGVQLKNGIPCVRTIGDEPAAGICGTGALEAAAELFSAGVIDRTGKLADPYFPGGFPLARDSHGEWILLTQQDIREIQMAKAAVRAGIEILILHSGIRYEDIGSVFLAGGFGYYLDVKKAAGIGLLPKELTAKTTAAGNTALLGALFYLAGQDKAALNEITEHAEAISLANDGQFQELYYEYMMF